MVEPSPIPRLTDIVEAIDHIRSEMAGAPRDVFEGDWRKLWLVERGVEIDSRGQPSVAVQFESTPSDPVAQSRWHRRYCATITKALRHRSCGRWSVTTCRCSIRSAARNSSPQRRGA